MALNFPANPTEGDLYAAEGATYQWKTNRWVKVGTGELLIGPASRGMTDFDGDDLNDAVPAYDKTQEIFRITAFASQNNPISLANGDYIIAMQHQQGVIRQIAHNWNPTGEQQPMWWRDLVSGTWTDWTAIGGGGGAAVTQGPTFPADPVVGDLHYLTVAVVGLYTWFDDGNSTQWVYTNDPEAIITGDPVEIVEADATAGWQVWGDTLVQWGLDTQAVTNARLVTFPQAFKTVPSVSVVAVTGNTTAKISTVRIVREGDFEAYLYNAAGTTFQSDNFRWIAIGEAPDALKKPKELQPIGGGSGVEVQEFHDPVGAASWRIVGTTLEMWGFISTSVNVDKVIPFPKTFIRPPRVQASPAENRTNITGVVVKQQIETQATVLSNGTGVSWYAIGEWDGVS